MADQVLVEFGASFDGYTASIDAAIKENVKLDASAEIVSKSITDDFTKAGKSISQAFTGKEIQKGLNETKKSAESLKAGLKQLYDEEVRLLVASKNVANDGVKKVREEATQLRNELQRLNGGIIGNTKELERYAKKSTSLTGELRNLKQSISQLEQAGDTGSKAFNELTIRAAKLEDQIGDTRERVRVLASDTFKFDAAVQGISALASGFAGVQGVIGLFGEQSKEVEQSLLKVQSALAIATAAQEVSNIVTGQGALKLGIITAAQNLFSTSLTGGAKAMKIFTSALAVTGLGALVIAIGLVINALTKLTESSDAAQSALRGLEATNAQLNKKIIESQEELDLARGKISQKQADRNKIERQQKEELTKQLIANAKALAAAEEEISNAQNLKRFAFTEKQNRSADNLLRIANQRKTKIIEEGDSAILKINEDFQNKYALTYVKEKDKEVETTKEKTKAVVQAEEIKYATLEEVILRYTLRISEINKKNADNRLQQDKDSVAARKSVLQAELAETLAAINVEEYERKQSGENLLIITQDIAQQRLKAELDYADGVKAIDDSILENETKNLEESQSNIDKWVKYRADKKKKAADEEKALEDEIVRQSVTGLNAAFDLYNAIGDARIQKAQENAQREIELAGDDAIKKKAIEKKLAEEVAAIKRGQAIADKAQALFNIFINTAQNIVKGPPPLVPLYIATGALQAAAVAARPIPKFEKGGKVKEGKLLGDSHANGGVLIEAEGNEWIFNKSTTKKYEPMFEAIQKGKFEKFAFERFQLPVIRASKSKELNERLASKLDTQKLERELQISRSNESKGTKEIIKAIKEQKSNRYNWN